MDIQKLQEEAKRIRLSSEPKIQYPSFSMIGAIGDIAKNLSYCIKHNKGKLNPLAKLNLSNDIGNLLLSIADLANDLNIELDKTIQDAIQNKQQSGNSPNV